MRRRNAPARTLLALAAAPALALPLLAAPPAQATRAVETVATRAMETTVVNADFAKPASPGDTWAGDTPWGWDGGEL